MHSLSHPRVNVVTATAIVLCEWALFVVDRITEPWCTVSLEVGRPSFIGLRVAGSLKVAGKKMWPVTFEVLPSPAGFDHSVSTAMAT